MFAHLLHAHIRGDQLIPVGRVDTVVARIDDRGAADSEVDLFGATAVQHLDNLLGSRSTDDAVVPLRAQQLVVYQG